MSHSVRYELPSIALIQCPSIGMRDDFAAAVQVRG